MTDLESEAFVDWYCDLESETQLLRLMAEYEGSALWESVPF